MTAFRSMLHKSLFQPSEERLIDVVQILPQGGKKTKKESYMCVAMTAEQPYAVRLYVTIPEFTMTIMDQNFTLSTSTYEEKEKFIRQLYKFANQYLPVHKPEFVNIQLPVEVVPVNQAPEQNEAVLAENLPLSAKEEADFYNLLSKSNLTIGEAKKFSGTLTQKLLELDGANIESIMGNEQAVTDLINLMDGAIEEVTCLEKQLDEMDSILLFVRDSVELIEEKDSLGQVERQNNEKLRKELEEFLYHLDTISDNHIRRLVQ
uniref:Exocyst complex component Sec3 C-terminal domain-containing protein n=1 Tax=Panagrolaimus davidi TaxID=227884 RepID=A0A914PLF8_9BILA